MELRLLALACLVGAAFAGPVNRDVDSRCATECSPSTNKFNYEEGKMYVYAYRGENSISIAGGRVKQKAQITGTAEIHVKGPCEMVLQMKNVRIQGSAGSGEENDLVEQLQRNPVHFSWSDGIIEQLCPDSSDSPISLNIKKAILSSFVNTMPDFSTFKTHKEVDSLGTCVTDYSSRGGYSETVNIHKAKDLKSCDNRHSGLAVLVVNSYKSPDSDINSIPIFTDEHLECEQEIHQRVIKRVICKERAVLQPLKDKDSIAEFTGSIELTLQSTSRSHGSPSVMSMEHENMFFTFSESQSKESKERQAEEILSELCSKTEGLLHPSVSSLYYRLIEVVRSLPERSVEQIYQALKDKKLCHSPKTLDIFLDTLPMVGTEGAIKLMVKLIKNKEVTGVKAKFWPASLALIPHPTAESVASLIPLLSVEEKNSPVLLGASAMIHKICSTRNCDSIESVGKFIAILFSRLGETCSSDNDDEVVTILKVFGNMGYCGAACRSIVQCATSKEKSIPRRLAAIDSFRRMKSKVPQEIISLYEDLQEDFEVRISALIAAVRFPDVEVFSSIQRVQKKETNEQVQAFTSSLLKNLNETSSPMKQEHKKLLEGIEIPEHNVPYWTNSKNIELSAYNGPLNLGGSIESNIIHSPGTSIPRSGTARIDVDLFGRNINLLEVGVRAEGLETAAKKLMGMHEDEKQKPMSSKGSHGSSKPEASFFLRTMDTEILDMSASDLTSMGNMMQFADVLNKLAQGESIDVAHSIMFVDSKIVVPSVTGRSYALSLHGTTSVGLSAKGKFDAVNLMSSPRNCDIEGRFQPSANMELSATVGIQSENPRPDVKIVTLLHSETDVEAKLRIKDGHLLHARWNLPSEKVDIFKLSTNLFEVDSEGRETPVIDEMRTKIDHCIRSLVKPLGVEFCGKLEIPHPFVTRTFPFARGIGNMEVSIRKTDPSMQGYELLVEVPKSRSDVMVYQVSLDTPGSSANRKHSVRLEMKKPVRHEGSFNLHIESPFKEISTDGSFAWHPEQVQGSLQVITDRTRRYSAKASLQISTSGERKSLKPTFQWVLPESEPVTVSGSISYVPGRKEEFMIDLKSNKPSPKPFAISGSVIKEGPISLSMNSEWKLSTDLIAKTPWAAMKIQGSSEKMARQQSRSLVTDFAINYKRESSPRHSVKFSSKAHESSGRIGTSAQFESSEYSSYNWQFAWDKQGRVKESMKNDLHLSYGPHPESHYIHIIQSSKFGGPSELSESKISLKSPQFGVDSELKVAADLNFMKTSNFNVETILRYSGQNHLKSHLRLQTISKKPLKMVVKAELQIPGRTMVYQDEIEEVRPNDFSGNTMVQWKQGKQASLQYRYKKLSDVSKLHLEVHSTFQAPFISSPVHHKTSLKITKESFELDSRASSTSQEEYFLMAKINRTGPSELSFKIPKVECGMLIQNEPNKKIVNLDLQYRFSKPRRIKSIVGVQSGPVKSIIFEFLSDAEDPAQKIGFLSELELSTKGNQRSYRMFTTAAYYDTYAVNLIGEGDLSLSGTHVLEATYLSEPDFQRSLTITHSASASDINSVLILKERNIEKIKAELKGNWAEKSSGLEARGSLSIVSNDGAFENKEFSFSHSHSRSGSSLRSNCQLRVQTSPSKAYVTQISLDKSPRESMDIKLSLSTPHRGYEKQQVRVSLRFTDGGCSVDAGVEYGSSKHASMSSFLKKTQREIMFTVSLATPHPKVREAKFQVSFDNQQSNKQAESHLEVNRKIVYETSISYQKQSRSVELRSHLKSAISAEYDAIVKSIFERDSFSHELTLSRNSRKELYCRLSKERSDEALAYSFEIQDIMSISARKETRDQTTKHTLDINGLFNPLFVKIQTTRNDPNSVSVVAAVCHGEIGRDCCNIKGYYKTDSTRRSRSYRKITLDVEHSKDDSTPVHMGSVHYLYDNRERLLKTKLIMETKNKKIGYDVNLTKWKNEGDTGKLEVNVIFPRQTFFVAGSVLRTPQRCVYGMEIVPDLSAPSKKLSVSLNAEVKRRKNPDQRLLSGILHITHESLEKPVDVTFIILKNEGMWPTEGKVEIDYSRNPGSMLVGTMEHMTERGHPENQELVCRMFREDKRMSFDVRILRKYVNSQKLYSWDWTYTVQDRGFRNGGLRLTISEGQNPTTYNATYYSPSSNVAVIGKTFWDASVPKEMKVKIISEEKLLGEAEYHREGSCSVMEIKRSALVFKNRVCLENTGTSKMRHLKIESHCHGNKCVDANIAFDPSNTQATDIELTWNRKYLMDTMVSLKEMSPYFYDKFLEEGPKEIYEDVRRFLSDIYEMLIMRVARDMKSQISTLYDTIKHDFQVMKDKIISYYEDSFIRVRERVDEIRDFVKTKMQILLRTISEQIPEKVKEWWKKIKEELQKYFDEICNRGTICHEVQDAFTRKGMRHVGKLFQHKLKEAAKFSSQRIMEATEWMPKLWDKIKEICEKIRFEAHKTMPYIFDNALVVRMSDSIKKTVNWIKNTYEEYYQKISKKIHEIIDKVSKNDDINAMKSIFSDAKEEAQKIWEKIDLKGWFTSVSKSVMHAVFPSEWISEKFSIESNIPNGSLKIHIHHPFDKSKLNLMKTVFLSAKKHYQYNK